MKTIPINKKSAGLLIAALLIIIYILVLHIFHLPASIQHHKLTSPTEITGYYEQDIPLVELTFDTLHYTGVDYYMDDMKVGAYYYYEITDEALREGLFASRYILVLVQTTTGQNTLTDYTCRCRITNGGGRFGTVLSTLSGNGRISYTDMEQMFFPLIYSEVDYPAVYITLTYIFLALAAIGIIIYLFSVLRTISFSTHTHGRV